jgi:hypothetical protein
MSLSSVVSLGEGESVYTGMARQVDHRQGDPGEQGRTGTGEQHRTSHGGIRAKCNTLGVNKKSYYQAREEMKSCSWIRNLECLLYQVLMQLKTSPYSKL